MAGRGGIARRRTAFTRARFVACIACVACLASFAPRPARADDGDGDDPAERGAVVGIGTLLLTSISGGLLMGRARTSFARDAGANLAGFGFAAAPLAGHLVNGEYLRAAAFTATPLVMAGADLGLMQHEPDLIDEQGSPATRVPFAIFFTVGFTSGVLGVVDAMFATYRRDHRRDHERVGPFTDLHVLPSFGRDGGQLSVGGVF